MAPQAPAISKMTQQQILDALGAPNMLWFDLWEDKNVQEIYELLREYDDRLQRTPKSKKVSSQTGRIWKSESFILTRIRQNPHKFTPAGNKLFAKWSRADLLVFCVKELIDCCDYLPIFSGATYTKDQVRAALTVFVKIASTCKGRTMRQVHPKGKKARLGPVLESEGYDWFDVLMRRVYNWIGEFIGDRTVLAPDHEAFKIHKALIRSERPALSESGVVASESESS